MEVFLCSKYKLQKVKPGDLGSIWYKIQIMLIDYLSSEVYSGKTNFGRTRVCHFSFQTDTWKWRGLEELEVMVRFILLWRTGVIFTVNSCIPADFHHWMVGLVLLMAVSWHTSHQLQMMCFLVSVEETKLLSWVLDLSSSQALVKCQLDNVDLRFKLRGGRQESVSAGTLDTRALILHWLWVTLDSFPNGLFKMAACFIKPQASDPAGKREVMVLHSLITEGTACCLCQISWLETSPCLEGRRWH